MTETTDRTGAWMQTYTGCQFYPLDPRPQDVRPADIAHALSLICRYGGHVDRFYSVAEHCVLLSHAVAPKHALWALLHDSAEAYVGDMVRPLKHQLPVYCDVEDRVLAAVAERFRLRCDWRESDKGKWVGTEFHPFRLPVTPAEVKEADNRILLDERAALMPNTQHPWTQDLDGTTPLGVTIHGWGPSYAEHMYIARLNELVAA